MNWTHIVVLASLTGLTLSWTYHFSNETMTWSGARRWCQETFSDLVVLQSQQENDHLVALLPPRESSPYFWIGISRSHAHEAWRWVGNNSTWTGNQSWAEHEPNNNSTEFCVEIYTSRGRNRGRWNDERCSALKYATCYQAQCTNSTCDRGKCHEVIDNVTCVCEPGFRGERCQTAVDCAPVPDLDNGNLICSSSILTVNSSCLTTCSFGFFSVSSWNISCQEDGLWSGPRPTCTNYRYALLAVVGSGAVSIFCCVCFCLIHHRKRRKIAEVRQQNEEEASPINESSG